MEKGVHKLLKHCHVDRKNTQSEGRVCCYHLGKAVCFAEHFSGMRNDLGCPGDIPGHQVRVMCKHMAKD